MSRSHLKQEYSLDMNFVLINLIEPNKNIVQEWKIGPTVLTLCEHLFVSFSIRMLRKQANKLIAGTNWKGKSVEAEGAGSEIVLSSSSQEKKQGIINLNRGVGKFLLSGVVAYIDGRLCRCIPNAIARRIVSGFMLSFLDKDSSE